MKPGIPWSVKGIEPEVREAAKHAARRSGMTLGEWLNTVILDQADENAPPESPVSPAPQKILSETYRASPRQDETTIRLEDIAQQLTRLARREQESASFRSYDQPANYGDDAETLHRILARIENNERQSVEAFTAVNERLSILGRQISATERQKSFEKPEDVPGFKAIETAIRNVVEHLETSEIRTREQLKAMQDRLAGMGQRAAGADLTQQAAPAIASLEARFEQLASRVRHAEEQPQSSLPSQVRQELNQLADRIEAVRENSESLAHQAQSAAIGIAQQELRDIESRVVNLLTEAQKTFGSGPAGNDDLQRLRDEIASFNRRIDDAEANTASEHDVHALRVAVEQLSARVAQGSDMRPLADMDRRLGELTSRLEQDWSENRHQPQLGDLERRIAELDHRLAEAVHSQDQGGAVAGLVEKIGEVNDRLDRAEKQIAHIDTIERAIQQLFEGLEQSRSLSRQVAEEAANKVADRFLANPSSSSGPSPELQALEDGLKAVRESAAASDQRSQETLSAVHETLEQIVNKLAELETSAAGHQLSTQLQQQTAEASVAPIWQPQEPSSQSPQLAGAGDSEFFDPGKIFQQPVFEMATPAPAVAASEVQPQLAAAPPETQAAQVDFSVGDSIETAVNDDFIAAARRAAQVAATNTNVLAPENKPVLKKNANSRFKLSLPMPKKKDKPKPAPVLNGKQMPEIKPAVSNDNSRRRLILAGILLLVAVGAFTFNKMMKPVKPVKQSTLIESVAPTSDRVVAPKSSNPVKQFTQIVQKSAAENSGLPSPGPDPAAKTPEVMAADDLLTGALPAKKTEASLTSIIAKPGSIAERPERPPEAIGSKGLRDAAVLGDAKAQFIIASRYLDGQGVEQDFTKAAYWYQLAATRGLAPAQYRVATLFERGRGVPPDPATALLWYERAAAAGNIKAMHNAAVTAAGNQVGTPNYDKAFKWFREAATRGLADSQFNLAVLFERGLGSRVDKPEALFWYSLAAKQGDKDAAKRADELANSLTKDTVSTIAQRATSWSPIPSVDDANVVAVTDSQWGTPAATVTETIQAKDQVPAADDSILKAQQLLVKLGFNVGEPDGRMGSRTANAIRLFQLQSGMKVTGVITTDVLAAMQEKAS